MAPRLTFGEHPMTRLGSCALAAGLFAAGCNPPPGGSSSARPTTPATAPSTWDKAREVGREVAGDVKDADTEAAHRLSAWKDEMAVKLKPDMEKADRKIKELEVQLKDASAEAKPTIEAKLKDL